MAVSIMGHAQKESGVDAFLRRLGGVANLANAGINTYANVKDMRAKSQAADDIKNAIYADKDQDPTKLVPAMEGEANAIHRKVRRGDEIKDEWFKNYTPSEKAESPEEIAFKKARTANEWANTEKIRHDINAKNQPKGLAERIKDLNSSDKARLDNVQMTIKGIRDMDAALAKGVNTFSLIGDNDYTTAERSAAEAFGRMQSGGAINKEEEKRFIAMGPKATDSVEQQAAKLKRQQEELYSRAKTLGFEPDELGLKFKLAYGTPKDDATMIADKPNSPPVAGARGLPENPKTITQNGFTYQYNDKTGKYEPKK